jgi:hypothetical protein
MKHFYGALMLGFLSTLTANAQPQTNALPKLPVRRPPYYSITDHVVAQLATPVSGREIVSLVHRLNIVPKELYFEVDINEEPILVGGYVLQNGESIENVSRNMQDKHSTFLREAMASLEEARLVTADPSILARLDTLYKQLQIIPPAVEDLVIGAIRIDDGPAMLEMLQTPRGAFSGVLSIRSSEYPSRSIKSVTSQNQNALATAAITSNENSFPWAPTSGTSKVTQGFTFQTFYFSDVGGFSSNSSYEHETQIYDTAFAQDGGYWTSNMPNAYHDTAFLDNIGIEGSSSVFNPTVGTSRASSLLDNTQYYTYVALTPGSATSATVKIRGQRGHRFPSWCDSTWCVFADQTTFPGWLADFTAPITYTLYWTF